MVVCFTCELRAGNDKTLTNLIRQVSRDRCLPVRPKDGVLISILVCGDDSEVDYISIQLPWRFIKIVSSVQ